MNKVKKITKYSKYFLFFVIASFISWIWSGKDTGNSLVTTKIPVAQADVFVFGGGSCGECCDGCGGGDC